MAETLRGRKQKNIDETLEQASKSNTSKPVIEDFKEDPSSEIEIYAKEVLNALILDNVPPTPNNFSLYFDRLLEDKSETFRKQIHAMLELEENNEEESTILLEQSLKKGFGSIKNMLGTSAGLYKNMSIMGKILEKRKKELAGTLEKKDLMSVIATLGDDVGKLNSIIKTQSIQMKNIYTDTANIVKNVENETIFDNQFGVYNKRYLLTKIGQEAGLVREFKHKSSLIMIELSRELKKSVNNEKAFVLMTRTIARILLKTSRRSDVVAYYGNGIFSMLLTHTDIGSAQKASARLIDLVSNSNFFLADREIQLKISIGITDINPDYSTEEIIVCALDGIEAAYSTKDIDYAVVEKEEKEKEAE